MSDIATAAICGHNEVFSALSNSMGCGSRIATCAEVFRCADCGTPFHRECLQHHCKDDLAESRAHLRARDEQLEAARGRIATLEIALQSVRFYANSDETVAKWGRVLAITEDALAPAVNAAGRETCGCRESYPQLQPGRINHGPGCYYAPPPSTPLSECPLKGCTLPKHHEGHCNRVAPPSEASSNERDGCTVAALGPWLPAECAHGWTPATCRRCWQIAYAKKLDVQPPADEGAPSKSVAKRHAIMREARADEGARERVIEAARLYKESAIARREYSDWTEDMQREKPREFDRIVLRMNQQRARGEAMFLALAALPAPDAG
jgi:hypothetical protein